MSKLTEDEAIRLLKKYSTNQESFKRVLAHARAVQKVALRIAKGIPDIDINYIKIGSLLHDIGRFQAKKTETHGIVGAEILRKEGLSEYATIAERHLGAGISKQDIEEQQIGLPLKDYMPLTKEEKIITHADNLIRGDKEIQTDQAVDRYRSELGDKVAEKIRRLAEEIENMVK